MKHMRDDATQRERNVAVEGGGRYRMRCIKECGRHIRDSCVHRVRAAVRKLCHTYDGVIKFSGGAAWLPGRLREW
jgi:hypothetical protein